MPDDDDLLEVSDQSPVNDRIAQAISWLALFGSIGVCIWLICSTLYGAWNF